MNIDDLMKAAPSISPEKLEFLKTFANMPSGSNSAAMMRQLANCQRQAKEQNIQFTPTEQDLMIQLLTANLSPAEKARVNQVLAMLKMSRH